MKDRSALLLTAIAMSAFAWLFWHVGGGRAAGFLLSFLVVALTVDNFRLRRLIRGSRQLRDESKSEGKQ